MLLKASAVLLTAALVLVQDNAPPTIPDDPGPMRTGQVEAEPDVPIQHRRLLEEVGTWNATLSAYMSQGMPPIVFQGVETNRMIGDAWLLSELVAEPMGTPYTGIAQIGYDVESEAALKTWIDSDSAALNVWTGTYDLERRERILEYTETDADGNAVKHIVKSRVLDAKHRTLDIFALDEQNGEMPVLHIDYVLDER